VQESLIRLAGQIFVWQYLHAKQNISPLHPRRLCGEISILDKYELIHNCVLFHRLGG
jgi:hypothetical protein